MKELSIEEKAHRYDEAIKVAKRNYETIVQMDKDRTFVKEGIVNTFHHMFPELKESEDERVKRCISDVVRKYGSEFTTGTVTKEKMLAWLEKQGEPRQHLELKAGNWYICHRAYCCRADHLTVKEGERFQCEKDGIVKGFVVKEPEKYFKECSAPATTECNYIGSDDVRRRSTIQVLEYARSLDAYNQYGKADIDKNIAWLEKQSEQKPTDTCDSLIIKSKEFPASEKRDFGYFNEPTDKVEPKFKVGDWVVSNLDGKVRQISEVHFDEYNSYYVVDGKSVNLEEYDRLHHLWTIHDAKDGDVLVHNGCTFIFMGIKNSIVQALEENFLDGTNPVCFGEPDKDGDYHPASKEQRDILMKVMNEAGYTFDFEKKKLKKIDNEEFNGEDYGIDSLFHAQRILEKTLGSVEGYQTDDGILSHKCAISAVKKLYGQKPTIAEMQNLAWTKEDESYLNTTIAYLKDAKEFKKSAENCINWLKSLKDRVQSKPILRRIHTIFDEII